MKRDAASIGRLNRAIGQSLLPYIIASVLRVRLFYAARVAFICDAEDVGRSDPAPPSFFNRTRRSDDENHPRGGIASHPGRGCRIFSRSRKKSSTNEILANSNSRLTSELGVRCTAWSKIQVNSRIIPTMTSMELPITPGTGVQKFRTPCSTSSKVCGLRLIAGPEEILRRAALCSDRCIWLDLARRQRKYNRRPAIGTNSTVLPDF